jgi:hypothetical protein
MHQPEVLDIIANKVDDAVSHGVLPHVIFDLDDTIFDAGSRTLHILQLASKIPEILELEPDLPSKLESLTSDKVLYHVMDTLELLGVRSAKAKNLISDYWWAHFFELCEVDDLVPGSQGYVQELHRLGADIIYLTGRHRLGAERGTLLSFEKNGFPIGERARLILKPEKSMCDFTFKHHATKDIPTKDLIVAAFDNEPRQVNMFKSVAPQAHVVFMDRRHAGHPERPLPEIPWIKDFSGWN